MPNDSVSLRAQQALAVLEAALASEFGIIVRVNTTLPSPTLQAKSVLYRFRQQLSPEYRRINIRLSPDDPDHELWLWKTPENRGERQ